MLCDAFFAHDTLSIELFDQDQRNQSRNSSKSRPDQIPKLPSVAGHLRSGAGDPYVTLARHTRYTTQRGEVALLQNGRGSERIQVELHGYGLAIGSRHGAPPGDAQDPLHVVNTPILHGLVSIGKEMEDSPCSAVAGESQFGPTLNLHRQRDALARVLAT